MKAITPNQMDEPDSITQARPNEGGQGITTLPLQVHSKTFNPRPILLKCAMLKDSTQVDINRVSENVSLLHQEEETSEGKIKIKLFDLLKGHFKLIRFLESFYNKIENFESNLSADLSREQFMLLLQQLKDLQQEAALYQEIRFKLGVQQLNCR